MIAPKEASTEMALPARSDTGQMTYDFVANALREAGGADAALIDLSGMQGSLGRGRVTSHRLRQLLPWDGTLVRYELSGAALQQLLAQARSQTTGLVLSGIREGTPADKGDTGGHSSPGSALRINGKPLRPEGRYRVVMLDSATPPREASAERLTITLHESLARYLLAHPFLRATPEGRVVAGDLPASVQCRDQLQPASAP